jgi:hypothetical protein
MSRFPLPLVPALVASEKVGLALPEVQERIVETSELDPLVSRRDRITAARRRDQPLAMLLLTLHYVVQVLRRPALTLSPGGMTDTA